MKSIIILTQCVSQIILVYLQSIAITPEYKSNCAKSVVPSPAAFNRNSTANAQLRRSSRIQSTQERVHDLQMSSMMIQGWLPQMVQEIMYQLQGAQIIVPENWYKENCTTGPNALRNTSFCSERSTPYASMGPSRSLRVTSSLRHFAVLRLIFHKIVRLQMTQYQRKTSL